MRRRGRWGWLAIDLHALRRAAAAHKWTLGHAQAVRGEGHIMGHTQGGAPGCMLYVARQQHTSGPWATHKRYAARGTSWCTLRVARLAAAADVVAASALRSATASMRR